MSAFRCIHKDETGKICIQKGRKMWGGFCFRHKHLDITLDAHYAKIEVKKITGLSHLGRDGLMKVRGFLEDAMMAVREGKMTPDQLVAICKGAEAHCRCIETDIEKLKIKHKIMCDSKRNDPGSPFRVLEIPTLDVLKQVSDAESSIESMKKNAATIAEAARPSGEGKPTI